MYTINDRPVFRRVLNSKYFQSALSNINCSFQNIMLCVIRSQSFSIWAVYQSVRGCGMGSRNNERNLQSFRWTDSHSCISHFLLDRGAISLVLIPTPPLCGSSMGTESTRTGAVEAVLMVT